MAYTPLWGVRRRVRTIYWALALTAVVLFLVPSTAFGATLSLRPAAISSTATPALPYVQAPGLKSGTLNPATAHPGVVGPTTNLFWSTNSTFAALPISVAPHSNAIYNYSFARYNYTYTFSGSTNPSVLNLSNGNTAVVFQTNDILPANASCPGSAKVAQSQVRISISSDAGAHFTSTSILPSSACKYTNSLEPAFAMGGKTIYGVFVENNVSNLAQYYFNRSSAAQANATDVLAFTYSTNNGTTFSKPVLLNASGNIARPAIAAIGNTIYVVWENISNSTSSLPGASYGYGYYGNTPARAIAIWFIASTNGGSSWSSPTRFQGLGSASYYSAVSPALAVSSTGELAATYATNRSCVFVQYGGCQRYGYDLYLITSTSNGSSWSSMSLAATKLGESPPYAPYSILYSYYPNYWAYFEEVPQIAITFGSANSDIYIAYAATTNISGAAYYYYTYYFPGMFTAATSNGGTSWTGATLGAPACQNDYYDDGWLNPAIGMSQGNVVVTYTWVNTSYIYYNQCGGAYNTFFDQTVSQWAGTSTDGIHWSKSIVAVAYSGSVAYHYLYYADGAFPGYHSGFGLSKSGSPILGFVGMGGTFSFSYYYNSTYSKYYYNYTWSSYANLTVAGPVLGKSVALNFTERNLPGTTPSWAVQLNGRQINITGRYFVVTGVPANTTVFITGISFQLGYRSFATPTMSVPEVASFSANTTVYANYSVTYGFAIVNVQPWDAADFYIYISGTSFFYDRYCFIDIYLTPPLYCNAFGTPFPWYINANTVTQFTTYPNPPVAYWNGTGNGSYNGTGQDLNITAGGPVNESVWLGMSGVFNEYVQAQGLPSTSTYSYAFDGNTHSSSATSVSIVANVSSGAHTISKITATSSSAGYEYFGFASTGQTLVVPAEPLVNLTFALVDVAAPVGPVSLHAIGLTPGTIWQFEFNGTRYTSSTPWINVTLHNGTYPVQGFAVTAQNSSVIYAPTVGSTLTVAAYSTYDIPYSQVYKVTVLAGTGGHVTSPGTHLISPGTVASYTATANTGYGFIGWTGIGSGSYTGTNRVANVTVDGPIIESAGFVALPNARFNLTIKESGLPTGAQWTAYVGAVGYSAVTTTILVPNLLACPNQYALQVPLTYDNTSVGTRYVPSGVLPATTCTNGTTVVSVNFVAQYYLTLVATPGGTAEAAFGTVLTTNSAWVTSGLNVQLSALANAGYNFLGWNGTGSGSYTGTVSSTAIVMGGPVGEIASFAKPIIPPPPRFYLSLHETQLVPGTSWSATIGSSTYSSTTPWINATGLLAANYPLSVFATATTDGLTHYIPQGNPGAILVTANKSVPIGFLTQYLVSVKGSLGGSVNAASNWYNLNQVLTINATPFPGYVFLGWVGTGAGAYSGTNPNASFAVRGPVTEYASFGPAAPPNTTIASVFTMPAVWGGLGAAGLVAGIGGGLLAHRRGRRSLPPPTPVAPASEGEGQG